MFSTLRSRLGTAAVIALAGAVLAPSSAWADTNFSVNVGALDSVIPYSNTFTTTVNGTYNLDYLFSMNSPTYETGSVVVTKGVSQASPTLKLYQVGANNSLTLVNTWGSGTANEAFYIGAGNYELAVTGQTADGGKNVVATSFSVGAAPIPAALPLFGSALVGVGLLGRRRNRTTA